MATIQEQVIEQLKTVYDPEIPVNIYDLGLIYEVNVNEDQDVVVKMTLTTPGCPVAHTFPGMVEEKVRALDCVGEVMVELVWDPPWTQDLMSEACKLELGFL